MVSLTSLRLSHNYNDEDGFFTWGVKGLLPTELGQLKNLQHLDLRDNYLTGTLVTELGRLRQLRTLNLRNNFLMGPIPRYYANCVALEELFLQDNNIDGRKFSVPEDVCHLPGLDLAQVDCGVGCSCCLTAC